MLLLTLRIRAAARVVALDLAIRVRQLLDLLQPAATRALRLLGEVFELLKVVKVELCRIIWQRHVY